MEFFYDGQIRRYIGQMIRMLSGFKYQSEDGKQTVVPVTYGDMTRQVASIIKDNSENKISSAPRIAVYVSNLQMDRNRLGDSSFISKVHIRERVKEYDNAGNFTGYGYTQGGGYTVERLMPTPYTLTVKADIWSTNTTQKLQIMEQIMMLFNPSLEIQTTDNFVDWTSLSVVELTDITFTSRTVPQGLESEIDIATLTFETPIWISPPSKVKRLGVIHDIIMNIHDESYSFETNEYVTVSGFDIFVYYDKNSQHYYAELLDPRSIIQSMPDDAQEAWRKIGQDLNWRLLLDQYGNKFKAGSSQIFLKQITGNEIVGTVAVNELDETKLIINFDTDTYNTDTVILGKSKVQFIVNPETWNPTRTPLSVGDRILLLSTIANDASAWAGFVADSNDIIEWDGSSWSIVFDSSEASDVVYTTNLKTGVQYKFEDGEWTRAFEGEYPRGQWKLIL